MAEAHVMHGLKEQIEASVVLKFGLVSLNFEVTFTRPAQVTTLWRQSPRTLSKMLNHSVNSCSHAQC